MASQAIRRFAVGASAAWILCAACAEAAELRIASITPARIARDAATVAVTIAGGGFDAGSTVRFMPAGTDKAGAISVSGLHSANSNQLVALIAIGESTNPGMYDIEVRNAHGDVTRARQLFLVEPYTWAARFGCTGVESWRRRIPCRRGTIY